jgi:ectoine hydroxylase-related dioxygenase (phytanoyl-CoA dioxygenase family)
MVDALNAGLESVYARQCDEVGGEEVLIGIGDADIVRCPLAYDPLFLDLALHGSITDLARAILGDAIVLMMQNGVINRPDRVQAQTKWHRDLNYQHWTSSKCLAIGALVCLEDFNEHTGGTVFIPSTHKFEDFPSQNIIEHCAVRPNAPAGSVIFFDSMIYHRAGINMSSKVRRGINHVIGVPIMGQTFDIPAMLGPSRRPLAACEEEYLGYRWNPVRSVTEWRLKKLSQMTGP